MCVMNLMLGGLISARKMYHITYDTLLSVASIRWQDEGGVRPLIKILGLEYLFAPQNFSLTLLA